MGIDVLRIRRVLYVALYNIDRFLVAVRSFTSYPQATRPEGVRRNALRAQRPKSLHSEESAQA